MVFPIKSFAELWNLSGKNEKAMATFVSIK